MNRIATTTLLTAACVISIFLPAKISAQDGMVIDTSFVHNDSLRSYLLYVPANYDGQEAWPLVINYHGGNTSPSFQVDYTQMNVAADSMGFLVAYPQGLLVTARVGLIPGWSVPNPVIQSDNDDLSFSDELINVIATDYNVDMNRIHATGWSMGSLMAYSLVCSFPERIASVAGVSSIMTFMLEDSCEPTRPISIMHFHGTLDPRVPFGGADGVWPSAPETTAFWAEQNNCAPDSVVTEVEDVSIADSTTVTRIEYIDCDDETEVVFYRVNEGGHPWPGSTPIPALAFLGHTNQDINASAEILAFFSRNPRTMVATSTEEEHFPSEISLDVFPNPFAERLTMEFQVQKVTSVKLTLYNVLGQKVHTIADETASTGPQRIEWSASEMSLPSGMYFLQLQVGEELFTKPIIRVSR